MTVAYRGVASPLFAMSAKVGDYHSDPMVRVNRLSFDFSFVIPDAQVHGLSSVL